MNVAEPHLLITRLVKRYGSVFAVNDISVEVRRGEFLTLLGPSGSGKTTTLSIIAGFEEQTSRRNPPRRQAADPRAAA